MTINNVTIGDKFIHPNDRKSKRISEVYDFLEVKSLTTGKHLEYLCCVKKDFLGQVLYSQVAFSTVVRYKLKTESK